MDEKAMVQENRERFDHPAPHVDVVRATAADMTGCEAVRLLFLRCLRVLRRGAPRMLIDLNSVDRADTKLVACLVAVYQIAVASSVRLELLASRSVLDVVEVCRLGPLIERTAPMG